ncbi:DUF3757 domain-containing protein [Robbsia sp. KACC 23696]|uniref:DUF3757 domain-containing protein n=1 Tax=Robbsia sp. KACC 23696 TaxID=3149231 RepID=UPI00325C3215
MKDSIRFATIASVALSGALGFASITTQAQAPTSVQSRVEHCPQLADMKKLDAVVTARTASGLQWVGVMQSDAQEVRQFQKVWIRPLDDKKRHAGATAPKPGISEFVGCRYDLTRGGSLLMRLSAGRRDDDLVSKIVPRGERWKRDVSGWGDVRYLCTGEPQKCTFSIAESH